MSWTVERARVASLTRSGKPDEPDHIELRRTLAAIRLEQHVSRVVAEAPPLTAEQRHRVAQLLAPSITVGGGAA